MGLVDNVAKVQWTFSVGGMSVGNAFKDWSTGNDYG